SCCHRLTRCRLRYRCKIESILFTIAATCPSRNTAISHFENQRATLGCGADRRATICFIPIISGAMLKMNNTVATMDNGKRNLANQLLNRAEQFVPLLREREKICIADKKVLDETIQEFKDAGFFRILQPARWG